MIVVVAFWRRQAGRRAEGVAALREVVSSGGEKGEGGTERRREVRRQRGRRKRESGNNHLSRRLTAINSTFTRKQTAIPNPTSLASTTILDIFGIETV